MFCNKETNQFGNFVGPCVDEKVESILERIVESIAGIKTVNNHSVQLGLEVHQFLDQGFVLLHVHNHPTAALLDMLGEGVLQRQLAILDARCQAVHQRQVGKTLVGKKLVGA